MSDREALLAAVFAHSADDAPRLVYADWLDEHGEPAQAAFIRTQIELARTDPNTDEYTRVGGQEYARWDDLVAELGPVAVGAGLLMSDFRRGFPATPIQLQVPTFRNRSWAWWPRLPVRALSTDLAPWNVGELVQVPYLARLRELVLGGADPHGQVIPTLVKCHLLQDLRVLDLNQFELGQDAAEALAATDAFPRLEELRLPFQVRPNRGIGRLLRSRFGDACRF